MYFLPAFFGEGEVEEHGHLITLPFQPETAWIAIFALVCIVVAILFSQPKEVPFNVLPSAQIEANILLALMAPLAAYTIATPTMFSVAKQDVLNGTDRLHSMFFMINALAFLFCMLTQWTKYYYLLIASLAGLGLTMYIGHRSLLAFSILGAGYIYARNLPLSTIKTKYYIGGFFALFSLSLYKSFYIAIKMGNYDQVSENLELDKVLESALVGAEPVIICRILDYVIFFNYKMECTNMSVMPLSLVPFLENILETDKCSFNTQMQPAIMSGYGGGVAANIWAEFYAMFGLAGIPILVVVLALIAAGIEALIRRIRSPVVIAGLVLAIIQFSFYIQRNELLMAITLAKRAVLVAIIIGGISAILDLRVRRTQAMHRKR